MYKMIIIFGQKYMNSPKSIAITCFTTLALFGNGLSASGAETQPTNKTFGDWCRQKASLSREAKHTVEVLLKKAGTTDCAEAERKLSSLTQLAIIRNQIRDLQPIASLSNLIELNLVSNKIRDIQPLEIGRA